jgi:hypothetical protein
MNAGPSRKKSGKQILEADSFADTGSGSKEVERRYLPDDGIGRTFAILDACGCPVKTMV